MDWLTEIGIKQNGSSISFIPLTAFHILTKIAWTPGHISDKEETKSGSLKAPFSSVNARWSFPLPIMVIKEERRASFYDATTLYAS